MASEIKVDTISEKTSTNGVTIDSLSIKDGGLVAEGNIDVNGNNLVLDANANTYLDAGTDDTIKFYVSGAHDLTISANAINVLSGTTLTIDSGATITNSGTANGFGSADPSSADGDTLGTASAEWSDLYLADGGIVYFGNDQDVKLTHNADKGLILKHAATADDKPVILTLQTGETDMAADDVIGKIEFQAPDEGTGTDAVLVSGAIQAVAEGNHSSSSNATSLQLMTGASEAATAKMYIKSDGKVGIGESAPLGIFHSKQADSGVSSVADPDGFQGVFEGSANSGISILSGNGNNGHVLFGDDGDNDIGRIVYRHDGNSMAFDVNGTEAFRVESERWISLVSEDMFLGSVNDSNGIASGAANGDQMSITGETDIRFYCGQTARFDIANNGDLTGTDTSISSLSDERLKKDIADYTYDLNTFKQLRPRTFTWKNPNLHTSDTDIRGFVGQEVKATDSYWTSEQALDTYSSKGKDEDGNDLGRDMSDADLIPANESGEHISITSRLGKKDAMYVSVINQLITKIETLEAKVTALEG